jgi:hypothetical protein
MKSKIFIYLSIFTGGMLLLSACKKSFLNATPRGTSLEANYYQNPDEAFAGLVAAYNPLSWTVVSSYCPKMVVLNLASDECYAGGGSSSDNPGMQAWNNYTLSPSTPNVPPDLWSRNYTGIYRVNVMLEKIVAVPGLSADLKARYTAEMQFLRAYYYFDLVRLFKNVPLILTTLAANQIYTQVQAKPADVYAQIEKDLKAAAAGLPGTVVTAENGRVTKGAALALLGKVILYQNNTGRMQEAAGYFEQVNTSPNYHLLPNFGDIFRPDNKFNAESIFEIDHTSGAGKGWGNWPNFDGNVGVQMVGPRGYSGPTFESNTAGYGFNPITPILVALLKNDPRYPYTIVNIDSLAKAGVCTYDKTGYQSTGYFIRKFAPLAQFQGTVGDIPLNWPNDEIEIRLADTYLMESEALVRGAGDAGKAQSYLDQVRARVGLSSVPATLDNIYNERRLELATEGHRFFDLVRTGQAASALASKGFTANKNEILPIPLVELNNTKLVQNPGYN